jgi:hypothetical protein
MGDSIEILQHIPLPLYINQDLHHWIFPFKYHKSTTSEENTSGAHPNFLHCSQLVEAMEQGKKKQTGRLQKVLREQKARLYIIRRCVVMLLCWTD